MIFNRQARAMANTLNLSDPIQTATEDMKHGMLQGSAPDADVSEFQRQMDTDMLRMMQDMHGPGYSGDPDIDFLTMMVPHHQGAVDMARLALVFGVDPLTRTIAEGIISNQQTEILAMKSRLAVLKGQPEKAQSEYPALSGTRGAAP